jgi:hypothetical protein
VSGLVVWHDEMVDEQTVELARPIPAVLVQRNRHIIGRAA